MFQVTFAETPGQNSAKYFESIRHNPPLLLAFLREMPKGGDLHVHLYGAIYAESMIDWAAQSGLCVDRATSKLSRGTCDACDHNQLKPAASCALRDQPLYDQLVNAWSMRNFHPGAESGHDHFFESFGKFAPSFDDHIGDALAEVATRAAADHLQYVELMHTADGAGAIALGSKIGWDDDFSKLRDKLLAGGMSEVVTATRIQLDADEAHRSAILHCGR